MRKMKDSGIEWIGQVPEEWEIKPIRAEFQEVTQKNRFGSVKSALKFTYGEIVTKENFDADEDDYVADTILNYTIVDPGVIMLNGLNLNFDFVTQRIGLVKERGVITSAYLAFKPLSDRIDPEFATYLFKTYDYCKAFHNMGGGVRKILNFSELKKEYVIYPPLPTQRAIADFLDLKCAEIDALSADIKAQIDTLNEYKRSVITETVTKGLDKNVPMKDSGIEWIGQVPEEWEIIPVKYCFVIGNGSDPVTDGDTPVYGSGTKSFKTCGEYKDGPAVLLGRKGTVNIPQYVTGRYWNVDTAFDAKSRGNYNLKLFFYDALCFDYENYSTQTALPSMTQNAYNNFKIPNMNYYEQQQIVSFLDSKCAEIDSLIETKTAQFETLAAYKKSLIYEYVTGKKEVSEYE